MPEYNDPLSEYLVYPSIPFLKGTPLQVVRWQGDRVAVASTASTSAATALPSTVLVELSSTQNVYLAFGGSGVSAVQSVATDASRLFLAGVQVIPVPKDSSGDPYTHFAVIRVDTNGVFQAEAVI